AVHDYQLDYIQLHGDESPEYCAELVDLWSFSSVRSAKLIKAFPVDEYVNFRDTAPYEPYADHFIFDTKGAGYGGTGREFDWSLLQDYLGTKTFLLSGGIQPDSFDAIRQVNHPQLIGVDINSGFEEEPALKNPLAVELFIERLRKN
ncbi:MAG: phosphoribosylanthranilate isomerase, partial [Saprospiraceae bacterium]|nr:phosphoribosylanthranilate isomerase [Saprospiraceae bacterium]